MPLSTFFSEGWLEPWYTCPRSTTGAPRQAWINAYDGVFYRLWFFDFTNVNNAQQNGNAYSGSFLIFTPISQRFQFLFSVPFIQSDKGGLSNTYHGNFGDFAVSPRFLLSETQDFSRVLDDRGPRYSYLSLTPGLRFHLANDHYFTTGIEVPLTGPKNQSFTYSPIFWLTKVW